MGGNALFYKVIIPAVFFLTSFAVTQSFSEDHKNDASIQDQSVTKANEVTTSKTDDHVSRANAGDDPVPPKTEDEKVAHVQDIKLPPAKAEEKPEKSITKTKTKKGKAVAKASRKAKGKAKHKRHAKAKAKQHRVASVKVKKEKTVAEAPRIEKQEQVSSASVKVEGDSKAASQDATPVKAEVEPLAKPVKGLLQVGQAVPNFSIVTESGQTVALEDYRGDILLIEFYETGCQTCGNYLPHLKELNSKFGKQGLQIIGMSIDQNPMIQKYASENRIAYPLVHANEAIKAEFGIHAVPVIYVVDEHGRVAGVFKGTSDQMHSRIEKLVKGLLRDLYKIPA